MPNLEDTMGQKTLLRYWGMVIGRAACRAWEKLGAVGTLLGIVVPIAILWLTKKSESVTDFSRSDVITTAEWIVGIFVVAVVIYIIREPVVIHNSQEITIAEKVKDIEGLKIRLGIPISMNIKILPYNDYPRLQNHELVFPMQIGITIHNSEFKDITDIDIFLIDAEQIYSGSSGEEMRMGILAFRAGERFDLNKDIALKSQQDTHIGLIENDGKNVYFLLNNSKGRPKLQFDQPEKYSSQDIEHIRCEFLFAVHGKVDGDKPIDVKRYRAKVKGFHSIIYNDAGSKTSIREESFSISMDEISNVENSGEK